MCVVINVCVSVRLTAGGYPAGCGRVSVHLPGHRSDVLGVSVPLRAAVGVEGVRGPAAVCAALSIGDHDAGVTHGDLTLHVWKCWAACGTMSVFHIPVEVSFCVSI